ncbi:helix-turn-helix domain-containing protein [Salibacterium halotolerans]|uniref:Helix-turn-helix domain-containing protein n=1 Tax=Salibacterium halotolerans TaxID=1884432 RepID=A0A1I5UVR2_9BACI|nr:helix-turn-helix domain-containing protein [Salibacterium halotolerans]SFP99345.1 hypothetical protein SAMN05518683_11475 [Salibacterium halotolerans]
MPIIESSGQVYDKSEGIGHFIRLPSDLTWYIHVDGYRAEMNYLYALIVDFYNVDYGYAYPSVMRLARHYGRNEKTTSAHLSTLRDVGLIDYSDTSQGRVYVPFVPLTRDELFASSPQAERNYLDRLAQEQSERDRSAQRWLSANGYR